ncbi:MAG: RsbRD N-terminal domain-containing protein [Pseudomonadota bacterium]
MTIKIESLLEDKKEQILRRWQKAIVETYPADTARFLEAESDPFANPVGRAIVEETRAALEWVISGDAGNSQGNGNGDGTGNGNDANGGAASARSRPVSEAGGPQRGTLDGGAASARSRPLSFDRIVRIRAAQDLSPAEALAFVFSLKKAMREELAAPLRSSNDPKLVAGLLAVESRIDDLSLAAFEVYAACLRKMSDIRVSEIKMRYAKLVQRLGAAAKLDLDSGKQDDSENNSPPGTRPETKPKTKPGIQE